MALENNSNGQGDIAQFLEKFKDPNLNTFNFTPASQREKSAPDTSAQYERSFEKLERKVQELEEKFDVSAHQNELILSELAHTREHIERQKDRDSFIEHLSFSIANLRASVENLTRAQQDRSYALREPDVERNFDSFPRPVSHEPIHHYEPDVYRQVQERRQREEQAEKERIISSLHQKASQLKAVNSALDREIKKVQQEKTEALKKSAEQAKEILSLRTQLSEAEARFKSFNFEGRIISIRQEYEQRVNSLETQLKEISETCMKQVEEIETLRAENIKLHAAAAEKEQLLVRLEEKEKELQSLREEMNALQDNNTLQSQNQQAIFSDTIRSLETQRDELTVQLQAAQNELDAVRGEKDQLEKNFKTLLEKINGNDAVIEQLKEKIEVLGQQNEQLAFQNTRLSEKQTLLFEQTEHLARQNENLVSRQGELKERLNRVETIPPTPIVTPKQAPAETAPTNTTKQIVPAAPAAQKPVETPVQPPAETVKPAPQAAAEPTEKVTPVQEARVDSPVEINKQAKPKVQTEADLPEIKVADPEPQSEPALMDGEDFLEKTDNFIGRIKWSIFNEDR